MDRKHVSWAISLAMMVGILIGYYVIPMVEGMGR